jgi:hypothetical protein
MGVLTTVDTRLILTARDGSVIGSWLIDDLPVVQTADGVVLKVGGEKLTIAVRKAESFAKALGTTGTSDVSGRIAKARQSTDDSDRVRPVLAAGLIVGVLILFGIGLWAADLPPFRKETTPPIALVVKTTATPAATPRSTTPRPPPTATPAPPIDPQWELAEYFDLSEFECTGRNYAIGARGNLTNVDAVTHDVWVTVDLLDEPGEVRIDRLQTYVSGIEPGETVQFEVEKYQGSYIDFVCEISGLSRFANW